MAHEQGSPEWLAERLGHCTASNFAKILLPVEKKETAKEKVTRTKYIRKVLAERLTGKEVDEYFNRHMERGNEQEPQARFDYEALTGNIVEEVGFLKHESLMAGASPDGLIDNDGGVEIKSVLSTTQLATIDAGKFPKEHTAQIQGNLWITGRQWWDFVSYSPDLPAPLNVYVFRVKRDEDYIARLEKDVITFLGEVEGLKNKLLPNGGKNGVSQ